MKTIQFLVSLKMILLLLSEESFGTLNQFMANHSIESFE